MNNASEMPKYKCHKEVWAVKISDITFDADIAQEESRETDGSAIISAVDEVIPAFRVDHEFMRKHNPQVGGYFVVYKDGYKSFSPAEAFEEGYTEIDKTSGKPEGPLVTPTFGSNPYFFVNKIIDRHGREVDPGEVVIFKVTDIDLLPTLGTYSSLQVATNVEHYEAVSKLHGEVASWQLEHPDRVKAAD